MNDAEILSVVFVAVMIAFYLMFLRPIQKDQEKHRQQIRDLRTGDEVVTTSGFIAHVRDIQVPEKGPTRISLEMADGVVFTALASAIAQRMEPQRAESATTDSGSARA
jgi:preprotein translocase subunit YajC